MPDKSHNEIEEPNNPDCKECFGCGSIFVYFVDHRKKLVIEEWEYCKNCYPESHVFAFDCSCKFAEEVSKEEAFRLIEKEGYSKFVP